VYLLDEPDANLDSSGIDLVATLLRELAARGKIVVVAAHTEKILQAADRVVRLEDGRIMDDESKDKAPRVQAVRS
jgi:energy-coupling factor transporter ATP-binding protein EcfA2